MKEVPAKDYLTSSDLKIIKNGNTCYNKIGQNYKNLNIKLKELKNFFYIHKKY